MRGTLAVKRALSNIPQQRFVPVSKPVQQDDVLALQEFVCRSRRLLVMTGAGISTESGIPDYRSEGVGLYARTSRRPVQYQDYISSAQARQRYWARNFVGWEQFATFQPNTCHMTLAEWEKDGRIHWLVTQNVDALHTKAGSVRVTELHGCTHRVMCLSCDYQASRWQLQDLFKSLNPQWNIHSDSIAPDGDVMLSDEQVQNFKVPSCPKCDTGILKPDVIFFGDNVAKPKVNFVYDKVDECDSLLVIGSSLFVYSGYRFVSRAADQAKQIGILNIGPTRADHLATLKIEARCGDILSQMKL